MAQQILIVDDDRAMAGRLAAILTAEGYSVSLAGNQHEAGEMLRAKPHDVILLDIGLPVLSGDSIANWVKIRYPQTRIIFMSGQYSMMEPERYGPNSCFLRKPLDIDYLLEVLKDPTAPPMAPAGER